MRGYIWACFGGSLGFSSDSFRVAFGFTDCYWLYQGLLKIEGLRFGFGMIESLFGCDRVGLVKVYFFLVLFLLHKPPLQYERVRWP